MSDLRFYLDESVPTEVARQLRRSGIDATSVHDLGLPGADGRSHLERASAMGRMLGTHDQGSLRLAAEDADHAGLAFALQEDASIDGWVRALRSLHLRFHGDEVRHQVCFLRL